MSQGYENAMDDSWSFAEVAVPVGDDPKVLASKAKALDTLLEALASACGKTVENEREPVTEALLDKVLELQDTRKRLDRAEAIVYAAEKSTSRRLVAMARMYRRDYPIDPGPPVAKDAPPG